LQVRYLIDSIDITSPTEAAWSAETGFRRSGNLVKGRTYLVLGLIGWRGHLMFLVRSDAGFPDSPFAGLFEVVDGSVDLRWRYAPGAGIRAAGDERVLHSLEFVVGFEELVRDPEGFLERLFELEPDARATFDRWSEATG
jgi:hypothetical protein